MVFCEPSKFPPAFTEKVFAPVKPVVANPPPICDPPKVIRAGFGVDGAVYPVCRGKLRETVDAE